MYKTVNVNVCVKYATTSVFYLVLWHMPITYAYQEKDCNHRLVICFKVYFFCKQENRRSDSGVKGFFF